MRITQITELEETKYSLCPEACDTKQIQWSSPSLQISLFHP